MPTYLYQLTTLLPIKDHFAYFLIIPSRLNTMILILPELIVFLYKTGDFLYIRSQFNIASQNNFFMME